MLEWKVVKMSKKRWFYNIEPMLFFWGMVLIMFLVLFLGACGNTITGLGKDISYAGEKVTEWQTKPSVEEQKVQ
mgnify:FL=1